MKMKRLIVCVLLALCLAMGTVLSGCGYIANEQGANSGQNVPVSGIGEGAEEGEGAEKVEEVEEVEEDERPEEDGREEAPENSDTSVLSMMKAASRYQAEPAGEVRENMISYRDEDHYYYMFYLGELNGVPLQTDAEAFYYGGNDYTYSFQKGYNTSQSISGAVKRSVGYCTSWTKNFSAGGTVNIAEIASFDLGYSKQWGQSATSSAESSYEKASSYSESYQASFEVSFDDRYPVGFFRWILYGDLDVFAAIVYDLDSGDYSCENYSVVASQYFMLDYSAESGRFQDGTYEMLPFDLTQEDIGRLPEPTEWISENGVSGEGTQKNPYIIRTAEDFCSIRLAPAASYRLAADIDLEGKILEPIALFSGTIDGDGHTVRNFTVSEGDISAETVGAGLICENRGQVFDLELENGKIVASPNFTNRDIRVYAGSIAAINSGSIRDCKATDVCVVANSSDTADRFQELYPEDPHGLVQGSGLWKTWITQSFYSKTKSWKTGMTFFVAAGGIVGYNQGLVQDCRFTGEVQSNLYQMAVPQSAKYCQKCFAGGVAGYNCNGTVTSCSAAGKVSAWLEMSNDAGGMGWVSTIKPRGLCYAGGVAGFCEEGLISDGDASGCTLRAKGRVYAAVYWLFSGAGYDKGTRASDKNMTLKTCALYGE